MTELGQYNFEADLKAEKEVMPRIAYRFKQLASSVERIKYYEGDREAADWTVILKNGVQKTIEVKEDKKCALTGNIAIELNCRGRLSGINVTKADFWLYVVHTRLNQPVEECSYTLVRPSALKKIVECSNFGYRAIGGDPGSHTEMHIINYDDLLILIKLDEYQ